jgi:hypothetical protein
MMMMLLDPGSKNVDFVFVLWFMFYAMDFEFLLVVFDTTAKRSSESMVTKTQQSS